MPKTSIGPVPKGPPLLVEQQFPDIQVTTNPPFLEPTNVATNSRASVALRELSPAQRALYDSALKNSHQVSAKITVYDQNEQPLFVLQDTQAASEGFSVTDGQVDVDNEKPIPRSLKLDVLDPKKRLVFNPSTPGTGVYLHRFIGVEYMVRVPGLSAAIEWVRVPIFMGPVSHFERSGQYVSLEALGKEILLQPPNSYPASLSQRVKSRVTEDVDPVDVITDLAHSFGETKLRVDVTPPPTWKNRYYMLGFYRGNAWAAINRIARSLGARVYYDGEGYLVVAKSPTGTDPVWTFADDDQSIVVSEPSLSYDIQGLYNIVRIMVGGTIVAEGRLRPEHPLSPESLARNGVPREIVWEEQFEVMTQEIAASLVEDRIRKIPLGIVEAEFTTLPVPHLDVDDIIGVSFDDVHETFVLQKFSIPLTVGGTMTFGFTKSVSQNVNPIVWSTKAPGEETPPPVPTVVKPTTTKLPPGPYSKPQVPPTW